MTGSKVRGRSSERIAKGILTELGYKILETNRKVFVDEVEAFEIDMIVISPKGEKYCVEVKSGLCSTSDIRQVYANSEITKLKPLIVCKGFADEAAEAVAARVRQINTANREADPNIKHSRERTDKGLIGSIGTTGEFNSLEFARY